jgi:hypothetical protein
MGFFMIDDNSWEKFRGFIREIRLNGVPVKYIGRPTKKPMYVTGTGKSNNKIIVGDIVLGKRDFVNLLHLTTSFSVDGELISTLYQE